MLARLRAARLRAELECWRAALTFCAVLKRAAVREPRVRARLEPVVEFFRARALGRPIAATRRAKAC